MCQKHIDVEIKFNDNINKIVEYDLWEQLFFILEINLSRSVKLENNSEIEILDR